LIRTLRKLVLGETWALPIGVVLAVAATGLLSSLGGEWWREGGGFVLLGFVLVALLAAVRTPRR
jgi:membrane protein implicated in regulation of membrane protease activity